MALCTSMSDDYFTIWCIYSVLLRVKNCLILKLRYKCNMQLACKKPEIFRNVLDLNNMIHVLINQNLHHLTQWHDKDVVLISKVTSYTRHSEFRTHVNTIPKTCTLWALCQGNKVYIWIISNMLVFMVYICTRFMDGHRFRIIILTLWLRSYQEVDDYAKHNLRSIRIQY